MLDFTSALYLSFEHPLRSLREWNQLTLGKPSALDEMAGAKNVEQALAALTGCESALLAPSTLHVFWDLFKLLAQSDTLILLDRSAYPIAQWGVERAEALQIPVRRLQVLDERRIKTVLQRERRLRPIFVLDGFSPSTGRVAPIALLVRWAEATGGWVVVDDTQALGILGSGPSVRNPYGSGGGGILRYLEADSARVVLVSSLAKAFGTPIAMLGGNTPMIEQFRAKSLTRVHCSPFSAASLQAAANAIRANARAGDSLRHRLLCNVRCFRRGAKALNVSVTGGVFPIQTLHFGRSLYCYRVFEGLLKRGVHAVLQRTDRSAAAITFVLRALQRRDEIYRALDGLSHVLEGTLMGQKGLVHHGFTAQISGRTLSRV